jgi:hypothetical protein
MTSNGMSEDVRYKLYRLGAHFAWWSAFAWTVALTIVNLSRPVTSLPTVFQRISGLFIILLMGVAIALGSALARMRLAKTIAKVFNVGISVAANGAQERQKQIIQLLGEEIESRRILIESNLENNRLIKDEIDSRKD